MNKAKAELATQLDELENHLNKVFNPIGCAIVKDSADIYRDQLWKLIEEAYANGEIDVMPEDIKVSISEKTGVLQAIVEWPIQEQIVLKISYCSEE